MTTVQFYAVSVVYYRRSPASRNLSVC